MGKIALLGLEFHGKHGVFAEETRLGARFIVDIELYFDYSNIEDNVSETIDYGEVYQLVSEEVTEKRYYLIEVLANTLAKRILASQNKLQKLIVRVHKPHAPLPGVFRDVFAEVELAR